jgi:hypothetical protein
MAVIGGHYNIHCGILVSVARLKSLVCKRNGEKTNSFRINGVCGTSDYDLLGFICQPTVRDLLEFHSLEFHSRLSCSFLLACSVSHVPAIFVEHRR